MQSVYASGWRRTTALALKPNLTVLLLKKPADAGFFVAPNEALALIFFVTHGIRNSLGGCL